MSNAIQHTENRFMRLLLVVLMTSVGFSLLVGCGKNNKGQVVGGPPVRCDKDCSDDDKKPYGGEPWLTALGVFTYSQAELGLDFYDGAQAAGAQGITPVPKKLEVDGALTVWGGNRCHLAKDEYRIVKVTKSGTVQPTSFNYGYTITGFEFTAKGAKTGTSLQLKLQSTQPNYMWWPWQYQQYQQAGVYAYPVETSPYYIWGRDGMWYEYKLYGDLSVDGCYL